MKNFIVSVAVVTAFILAANEGSNLAPNVIGLAMIGGLVWLSKKADFRVSNKSKDPDLETPKKSLRKLADMNPKMKNEIQEYLKNF